MTTIQKTILIVMAVILTVMVCTAVYLAVFREPGTVRGEFVPPEFDASVQSGTPGTLDEDLAYGTLELNKTAVVSMCANVTCENNAARVYFTSHEDNEGWLKIKLFDAEGNLLGQSGLVHPGEYIESVALTAVPKASGLVVAKILIYEPETYLSLGSAQAQVMLIPEQ